MHPSEMSNEQLRLAIAEVIAKRNGWRLKQRRRRWCFKEWKSKIRPGYITEVVRFVKYVPNYPSDDNAALGLLIKEKFWSWAIFGNNREDNCMVQINVTEPSENDCAPDIMVVANPLPRAISEAVYMGWLKARRNDG